MWLGLQIETEKCFEALCKLVTTMNKPEFLERMRDLYQKLGAKNFMEENKYQGFMMPFRDVTTERKLESRYNALENHEKYLEKFGSQNKDTKPKTFRPFKKDITEELKRPNRSENFEQQVRFLFHIFY